MKKNIFIQKVISRIKRLSFFIDYDTDSGILFHAMMYFGFGIEGPTNFRFVRDRFTDITIRLEVKEKKRKIQSCKLVIESNTLSIKSLNGYYRILNNYQKKFDGKKFNYHLVKPSSLFNRMEISDIREWKINKQT